MPALQIPCAVEIEGESGRILAIVTESASPATCVACDQPGFIRITDADGHVFPWCRECLELQQGPTNPDTYYQLVRRH